MAIQIGKQGQDQTVGEFFSRLSADYDDSIIKAVPPYREMLDALLGYLFKDSSEELAILELGCGTGNLSRLIVGQFPNARVTLADLSPEMLAETERKIRPLTARYELLAQGFSDLRFQSGRFDLILSSLALHHLRDPEKQALYRNLFAWLKPGGVFRCADQCLALPEAAQTRNHRLWVKWCHENGATDADIALWEDHAVRYDHYTPLAAHLAWLTESGFADVDCYWKKAIWTVFGGRKPAKQASS